MCLRGISIQVADDSDTTNYIKLIHKLLQVTKLAESTILSIMIRKAGTSTTVITRLLKLKTLCLYVLVVDFREKLLLRNSQGFYYNCI